MRRVFLTARTCRMATVSLFDRVRMPHGNRLNERGC